MNRPLTKGKRQMFASIFKIQQTRGLWEAESRKPSQAFTREGHGPRPALWKGSPGRGSWRPSLPSPRGAGRTIPPFVEASPSTQPLPLHRGRPALDHWTDRIARPAGPELGQHPGAPRPPGGGAAPGRTSLGPARGPQRPLSSLSSRRWVTRVVAEAKVRPIQGTAEEGRGAAGRRLGVTLDACSGLIQGS